MKIWKYAISGPGRVIVPIPYGCVVLHVGVQNGSIFVWVAVKSRQEDDLVDRAFYVAATGEDLTSLQHDEYLGTVQIGEFVWHVFDLRSES